MECLFVNEIFVQSDLALGTFTQYNKQRSLYKEA